LYLAGSSSSFLSATMMVISPSTHTHTHTGKKRKKKRSGRRERSAQHPSPGISATARTLRAGSRLA
jgi:hypothetical protein